MYSPSVLRRMRCGAALAVAALSVALTATPALAHVDLTGSNPHDGSSLNSLPGDVTLTFSESLSSSGTVAVIDPTGEHREAGEASIVDDTVSQPLAAADAPNGKYRVSYKVTSADGHLIQGTLTFGVSGPAAGKAEAGPADGKSEAAPVGHTREAGTPAPSPVGSEDTRSSTAQTSSELGGGVLALIGGLLVAVVVVVLGLGRVAWSTQQRHVQ